MVLLHLLLACLSQQTFTGGADAYPYRVPPGAGNTLIAYARQTAYYGQNNMKLLYILNYSFPGKILHNEKIMTVPTLIHILKILSQHETLMIFNHIGTSNETSDFITRALNMSNRDFYSRVNRLRRLDLVSKVNGRYHPTSMGKVVYDAHLLIGCAVQSYWKLLALDSICSQDALPAAERKKLVEHMVLDEKLHNLLTSNLLANELSGAEYLQRRL